jgi:hypothetical protein
MNTNLTAEKRLATLAQFIRNQVGLAERPPPGCIQLNNEEALLCAQALERAVETEAPHVTLLCTDPEIRALFNKAIGVQYRNKFSYSFETEGEAERAFHFIGSLGELQMSRPPPETTAELARYKQALQRANGFLIMHELEPVKLEYSSEKDCEVCHGSGEIVFNKQGGDPAYDESKPCPECSTAGGGHG